MNKESENKNISSLMNSVLKNIILLNKEMELHFGMSSARILTLLAFTEKITMKMNELSNAMSLTTSTSTRMINGLVKKGFVERGHDQFDRRLVVVGLTSKGNKVTKDIKEFRDKYFDSIKEMVEGDGKEDMISSLKILIDSFDKFKSRL